MQVFEVAVMGTPVTQGSMRKSKTGHIVHEKADQLYAWRQEIEDAFYEKYGADGRWVPINKAVRVEVILTVPRTRSMAPGCPEFADTKPDVDKLARAVGDALSPGSSGKVKTGPRAGQKHFRMLAEDGRIVSWGAQKTYPWGNHTHRAALTEPGAQIRVVVLSGVSRADMRAWGYRV
jgi:Holliday junction resolvase RusA-like endonuclease